MKDFLFTSESVSEGHPDKISDQISDAVLDQFLAKDSNSHVACETYVSSKLIVVGGEFRSGQPNLFDDIERRTPNIVRQVFDEIGYWSEIKLDIIERYALQYSRILSSRKNPEFYHIYIDAFAGSGKHISRTKGSSVRGSPQIALSSCVSFFNLFCFNTIAKDVCIQ